MRQCIFCGKRANSKEHLWPEWILKKVKPKNLVGFVGHTKNIAFGSEVTVRTVCRPCNHGWMHRMEVANIPIMGPLIDDASAMLDAPQQWAVSAWAVKTAMVLDSASASARPLFYTQAERDGMMASSSIPSRTAIWLGRFLGHNILQGTSVEVKYRMDNAWGLFPSHVATFVLGSLAMQVTTIHVSAEYGDRATRVNPAQGPWDHILINIWPNKGRRLYWPPVLAFDESRTLVDISTLADRWEQGREVPIPAKERLR